MTFEKMYNNLIDTLKERYGAAETITILEDAKEKDSHKTEEAKR